MFTHILKNFKNNSHQRAQDNGYRLNTDTTTLKDDGTSVEDHASRNVMWHHLRVAYEEINMPSMKWDVVISMVNGDSIEAMLMLKNG